MNLPALILLGVGFVLTVVGAYRLGYSDGRAAALRDLHVRTSALARLSDRRTP